MPLNCIVQNCKLLRAWKAGEVSRFSFSRPRQCVKNTKPLESVPSSSLFSKATGGKLDITYKLKKSVFNVIACVDLKSFKFLEFIFLKVVFCVISPVKPPKKSEYPPKVWRPFLESPDTFRVT